MEAGRVETVRRGRRLPPGPDRHEPARPSADPASPSRSPASAAPSPTRATGLLRGAPGRVRALVTQRGGAPAAGRQHPRRELGRLPRRLVAGARRGEAVHGAHRAVDDARRDRVLLDQLAHRRQSDPDRYSGSKAPAPSRRRVLPVPQGPDPGRAEGPLRVHAVRRQVQQHVGRAAPAERIEGRAPGRRRRSTGAGAASVGRYSSRSTLSTSEPRPSRRGSGRLHGTPQELDGGVGDPVDRAGDGGGHHEVVDDDDDAERSRHWRSRTTSST